MPVGKRYPFHEPLQLRPGGHTVDGDLILLLDPGAGVRDTVSPVAVVRQQQQPLGIAVEPPDREEALGTIDEREGGRPALGVAGRRHHADRLVQHDVDMARRHGHRQRPAVDRDLLAGRVGLRARIGHDRPIYRDPPGRQYGLGPPSRRQARVGQNFVQAHGTGPGRAVACLFNSPPGLPPGRRGFGRRRRSRPWSARPHPCRTTRSARYRGAPTASRRRSAVRT